MTKKAKITAFILASVLASASLAGCGNQNGNSTVTSSGDSAGTSSAASTAEESSSGERVKLTWVIASDQSAYKDGNVVEQELEKRFNVDITTLKINAFDNEKLNVTLASGTIPDVLIKWGVSDFYRDGIIRGITQDQIKENMPKTYQAMMDLVGDSVFDQFTNADGTLMAVPQLAISGSARLCEVIRQDWLDNLGLSVPTTLDEYEEVLRAFTFDDPDQNGQDDTYGMGGAGMHPTPMSWQFMYTFGAYGVNPSLWQEHDGKVVNDVTTEGYKEALKKLAAWYEEGLIDREFVTTQNADYSNKFVNGQFGIWEGHPTYLDPNAATGVVKLMKDNNPSANPVMFAPVTGPNGDAGTTSYGVNGGWGLMFGVNTTDEQVKMGMQIAEAINNDVDLFTLIFSGIEGEHFTYDGEMAVANAGLVKPEYGISTYNTGSYISWDIVKVFTPEVVVGYVQESAEYPLLTNAINTSQLVDIVGSKADTVEIDKLVNEFYFNGITGKIDIDAEWDKYIETYNNLGGAALEEEAGRMKRIDQ